MKKTIYLSLAVLCLMAGCSEEFLVEEPRGVFYAEGSLSTRQDALAAVDGVYSAMSERYAFLSWDGVDEFTYGASHHIERGHRFIRWNFNASDSRLSTTWESVYIGINHANWAMQAVAEVPESASFGEYTGADGNTYSLRERYIAEAMFMRAVAYFYLTNIWGAVPLITEPFLDAQQDFFVTRTSMDSVFTQLIIPDLEYCANVLPLKSSYGAQDTHRPSGGAADAMLAKTYLYLGDYTKYQGRTVNVGLSADALYDRAIARAQKVIQSGEFRLYDDYRMTGSTLTEYGDEYVFSFPHQEDANGNFAQLGARHTPFDNPVGTIAPGWRGGVQMERNFVRSLPFDYRRWVGVYYAIGRRPGYYCTRFWDMRDLVLQNLTSNDFQIIRYAEVLLIYADAANERNNGPTAQAAEYLSLIRQRATRFFGEPTQNDSVAYEQSWGSFGIEFTPDGTLTFAESADRPNNTQEPLPVDFSNVDLSKGVPRPVDGSRSNRPDVSYDSLYLVNAADLAAMDYETFYDEVWNEYDYEFPLEATRTFDFFRKGRLFDLEEISTRIRDNVLQERHYYFPLPEQELIANPNLEQNPGW